MEDIFWKYLAYGLFITQTLAVILLLEFIVFGRPLISLFFVIFGGTLHFNIARNPDAKIARYWPFLKR